MLGQGDGPRVILDNGTSVDVFLKYLETWVMDRFRINEAPRTFLWDNLNSHKNDRVVDAVYARGHRVLCRPPYRPHCGPIEWVFDQLGVEVRSRWEYINCERDLLREVNEAILRLKGFDEPFRHVGYIW